MPTRTARRPTAPHPRRLPGWAKHIPDPQQPLPEQLQEFLDWLRVQRGRPPTTVRAYRQDLAKLAAFRQTLPDAGGFCAGLDRRSLRRYQLELAEVLPHPRSRARALV